MNIYIQVTLSEYQKLFGQIILQTTQTGGTRGIHRIFV